MIEVPWSILLFTPFPAPAFPLSFSSSSPRASSEESAAAALRSSALVVADSKSSVSGWAVD